MADYSTDPDTLRFLYGNLIRHLEFCKLQQWRIASGVLALDGAVVGSSQLLKLPLLTQRMWFLAFWLVALVFLCLAGIWLLCRLQGSQRDAREDLVELRQGFPEVYRKLIEKRSPRNYKALSYHGDVLWLLVTATFGGFALTIWILCATLGP